MYQANTLDTAQHTQCSSCFFYCGFLISSFDAPNLPVQKFKNRAIPDIDDDRLITRAAIREGALKRVRPKVMTVAVIIAGLLPILLGSGTGSKGMIRLGAHGGRHGHSTAIPVCYSSGLSPDASPAPIS